MRSYTNSNCSNGKNLCQKCPATPSLSCTGWQELSTLTWLEVFPSPSLSFALHTARRGWQLFPNTEPMFNSQNEGSEDVQKAQRDSTIQSSQMGPTISAYFTSNSTKRAQENIQEKNYENDVLIWLTSRLLSPHRNHFVNSHPGMLTQGKAGQLGSPPEYRC